MPENIYVCTFKHVLTNAHIENIRYMYEPVIKLMINESFLTIIRTIIDPIAGEFPYNRYAGCATGHHHGSITMAFQRRRGAFALEIPRLHEAFEAPEAIQVNLSATGVPGMVTPWIRVADNHSLSC